jgi:hypothetical protein
LQEQHRGSFTFCLKEEVEEVFFFLHVCGQHPSAVYAGNILFSTLVFSFWCSFLVPTYETAQLIKHLNWLQEVDQQGHAPPWDLYQVLLFETH